MTKKKSILEGMTFDGDLDKCIFTDKEVRHFYFKGKPEPNCKTCDGYGEDSKKYGWNCYKPKYAFLGVFVKT